MVSLVSVFTKLADLAAEAIAAPDYDRSLNEASATLEVLEVPDPQYVAIGAAQFLGDPKVIFR